LELVKARQALQGIPKDQNAPPLADSLQAAGDRAFHIVKTLAPHGVIKPVTFVMQLSLIPIILQVILR
jgi:hypothetical protein